MACRRLFALSILAWAAGCAARVPPPPAMSAASSAAAAPPVTLGERVRREAWLTRFWEQLTPTQRGRVLARMRRAEPPLATREEEAAPVWDGLGLPERNALLFGPRPPRRPRGTAPAADAAGGAATAG
ncbi:hypothetical protein [Falsiroseomonas sp. CW058]|uniref:hypothetical protein n=1 Tax=Falsiroseomonas sp. CW058 TaxID=3388664 RepID=UPI003D31E895